MQKDLQKLIEISRYYGKDKNFVIAGGGNTSLKTGDRIRVKASGHHLSEMDEAGFVVLDRERLKDISRKTYPEDPVERNKKVRDDLMGACISKGLRPSVETSLHNLIPRKFVVHLHPTLVNGLLCANEAETNVKRIFGMKALYIPYTDPGYSLFMETDRQLQGFRRSNGREPEMILLQNHGIFVGGDTPGEIRSVYDRVISLLQGEVKRAIPAEELPVPPAVNEILPPLTVLFSDHKKMTLRIRNNALVRHFTRSADDFRKVMKPFTPDNIIYCKSAYIYCETKGSTSMILENIRRQVGSFKRNNGYLPRVILIRELGMIAAGEDAAGAEIILDVFQDMMKISWLSEFFGGPHFLDEKQINMIL